MCSNTYFYTYIICAFKEYTLKNSFYVMVTSSQYFKGRHSTIWTLRLAWTSYGDHFPPVSITG